MSLVFFLDVWKIVTKICDFGKTLLGGAKKKGIVKNLNVIYLFDQKFFLLIVFCRWKENAIKISIKFLQKKRKLSFESVFSYSFDELHCSPT